MIAVPLRDRIAPRPHELLSLGERSRYLFGLRVAFALSAVVYAFVAPDEMSASFGLVVAGSTAYLALASIPHVLERRSRALVLPSLRAMLLLDGIFLAGVVAVSGGATSPLRLLALGHVVAVILLFSYRSGLKLALWHTLLFLLVVYWTPFAPLGPTSGRAITSADERTALITIVGLWLAALGTATFAALSERELRRQKTDLERLSVMLTEFEGVDGPQAIAQVLLDELCETFACRRGVVLGGADGTLGILAATVAPAEAEALLGMEPLVYRARSERAILAVRAIDAETDPALAALLPDARNVLVIPLRVDRGQSVGLVVLERGGRQHAIRRSELVMIEQFASHGAFALNDAWLSDERRRRLEEIRALQYQLEAINEDLERTVVERTSELRTAVARLEETDEQRRRLLHHVVRAGEEERQRIAGDLHDDPVQKLVALKMRLELLGHSHPELEDLPEARDVVLLCIHSLRHMLFDLRPPVLDEQGLAVALRSFLENAEVTFDWSVTDELEDEPSPQTRLILYRIAQEVLTNARKHAEADEVRITLVDADGGVAMEITDDGVGFEPRVAVVAAPGHLGLVAIRERAEMAGGRCELHSLPGQGTTIDIWLPIEAAEGHETIAATIGEPAMVAPEHELDGAVR
ncbi:MAG TPA: GAF domain-containing sensor histidine kinase [Actinomycetota bacterium]|nr:GAF domain-containing sensor histidine kinase [Actinomycetota bacterium]